MFFFFSLKGLVPEQTSQMAENRENMGYDFF